MYVGTSIDVFPAGFLQQAVPSWITFVPLPSVGPLPTPTPAFRSPLFEDESELQISFVFLPLAFNGKILRSRMGNCSQVESSRVVCVHTCVFEFIWCIHNVAREKRSTTATRGKFFLWRSLKRLVYISMPEVQRNLSRRVIALLAAGANFPLTLFPRTLWNERWRVWSFFLSHPSLMTLLLFFLSPWLFWLRFPLKNVSYVKWVASDSDVNPTRVQNLYELSSLTRTNVF